MPSFSIPSRAHWSATHASRYVRRSAAPPRVQDELNEAGWKRPMLGLLRTELVIVRGKGMRSFRHTASNASGPWKPTSHMEPTQLSIPHPTLARRLPVRDEAHYSKVPLYVWRMSGRLVAEVADALVRGARAHEEFLVPTVCQARLVAPPCDWRTFSPDDIGVPGGANKQDSWYMGNRPEFRAQIRHNLTGARRTPTPHEARILPYPFARAHNRVPGFCRRAAAAWRVSAAARLAATALPPRQGTTRGADQYGRHIFPARGRRRAIDLTRWCAWQPHRPR